LIVPVRCAVTCVTFNTLPRFLTVVRLIWLIYPVTRFACGVYAVTARCYVCSLRYVARTFPHAVCLVTLFPLPVTVATLPTVWLPLRCLRYVYIYVYVVAVTPRCSRLHLRCLHTFQLYSAVTVHRLLRLLLVTVPVLIATFDGYICLPCGYGWLHVVTYATLVTVTLRSLPFARLLVAVYVAIATFGFTRSRAGWFTLRFYATAVYVAFGCWLHGYLHRRYGYRSCVVTVGFTVVACLQLVITAPRLLRLLHALLPGLFTFTLRFGLLPSTLRLCRFRAVFCTLRLVTFTDVGYVCRLHALPPHFTFALFRYSFTFTHGYVCDLLYVRLHTLLLRYVTLVTLFIHCAFYLHCYVWLLRLLRCYVTFTLPTFVCLLRLR